ncbi:MAG: hypothetical protein EI684_19495 [Candidatus Viridilinea halotolerans]|uniref:Type II secretion system protein GspF domain-containing protein n=1 Tax=Candidatus Viridilinea halotolerans TaxID=2491704 RepID=A0A426TSM9_9CHLR|nr:MAG: hypothetical protein EI684_19495 [Candidatus Viridilinea halotolerans]
MPTLVPQLTHPETAWLIYAVMPALAMLSLLVITLLLRPRLAMLITLVRTRQAHQALQHIPTADRPDPALCWTPESIPAAQLAGWGLAFATIIAGILVFLAPLGLALLLGAPLAALATWLISLHAHNRYINDLNRDLTGAVGRLGALLRAGSGLRPALERICADVPTGPLRDEWGYLLTRQGMPLSGGGIATPQQVVLALADQTPSQRHATFLNHLGASVGQPQEVLAKRCEAAYSALQLSERRRDEAQTELAQMRYSGVAVGLAGLFMASYLVWTQWDRVIFAYSSSLGSIVGVIVVIALALPIVGGMLLAQVEDSDY